MKKLIYILFIVFPLVSAAQPSLPRHEADSLWRVWQDKSQPDTNRLQAFNNYIQKGYLFTLPDSASYFAQLQYDFAKAKGLKKHMATALNTQAVSFSIRGNYAKAINYYKQSLKIREEIGDKKGIASSLNNMGFIYLNQGDYAKASEQYTRCLLLYEQIGYQLGIANTLNNIGLIYQHQSDYTKAIDYYTQSLKIYEQLGDKRGIAGSLNNIGTMYNYQNDYDKVIDYYTQSLKIREKMGDQQGVGNSLNNIGVTYRKISNYSKAVEYFTKSLKIREKIGDKKGIAGSLNNIGNLFMIQGEYVKAINYNERALKLAQEVGVIMETRGAAESLWEINKKLGRYKQSLEMYELYIQMRDSILSEENQKEVIRQEYKYEYEKQAAADSVAFAKEQEIKEVEIARQEAEIKARKNQQYAMFGGLFLVLVFAGFMYNRFKVTQKQKKIIEEQKEFVETAHKETQKQKEAVEEAHKEIRDSINYAKRIQNAILPPLKLMKEYLPESFIFYKPKDVVAGDFYWLEHKDDNLLFAAADCTGHGVPGAIVSVVCNNALNRTVREYRLTNPAEILNKTREIVVQEFEKSEEDVKDGMDISLCSLKLSKSSKLSESYATLQWAGANNPLWLIRPTVNGRETKQSLQNEQIASLPVVARNDEYEIIEYKPNKQPIGKTDNPQPFTTHTIELQKEDIVYVFTDGFADQFGGEKGKKFMYKPFKELLLSIQNKTMDEQKIVLEQHFENWKGKLEQVDDVCVIGVRI